MNEDIGKYNQATILAQYTDKKLRKGGTRSQGQADQEALFDSIVQLFSYLDEKDLFLEVYRNLLARRLLTEKSEDIEMEKIMITNLKLSCGMSQIRKLEGMIADLGLAKEETKKYEAHVA